MQSSVCHPDVASRDPNDKVSHHDNYLTVLFVTKYPTLIRFNYYVTVASVSYIGTRVVGHSSTRIVSHISSRIVSHIRPVLFS